MGFHGDSHAEIAIRIWQPKADISFRDSRYHAYIDFEFGEMYEKMVRELKGEL